MPSSLRHVDQQINCILLKLRAALIIPCKPFRNPCTEGCLNLFLVCSYFILFKQLCQPFSAFLFKQMIMSNLFAPMFINRHCLFRNTVYSEALFIQKQIFRPDSINGFICIRDLLRDETKKAGSNDHDVRTSCRSYVQFSIIIFRF